MNFSKKELNECIHFVLKNNIASFEELEKTLKIEKNKLNEIIKFLKNKYKTEDFNILFSFFKKTTKKSLKSKRTLIEDKYNKIISTCWN
jgi:hypothetical protein